MPAAPPARRGYGYVASAPVVDGVPVVLVQVCRFLRAGMSSSDWYGMSGDGTGEQMFCPRAHCSPENRAQRASARHSAVKTAEGACERSEVVTARRCRALQSHAVFRRNAPDKNVNTTRATVLAGTGELAPNARTESRAARG